MFKIIKNNITTQCDRHEFFRSIREQFSISLKQDKEKTKIYIANYDEAYINFATTGNFSFIINEFTYKIENEGELNDYIRESEQGSIF